MPTLCKYADFIDNCFPSALPGNFSAPPPIPIEKGRAYCNAAVSVSQTFIVKNCIIYENVKKTLTQTNVY